MMCVQQTLMCKQLKTTSVYLDVSVCLGQGGEQSSALHHKVNLVLSPRDLLRLHAVRE